MKVLQHFPPVRFAFAYGSGVFKQQGYAVKDHARPLIDVILVVDHPVSWHTANLERHAHHYSSLRLLGPRAIAHVQEHYGTGVYFNPFVTLDGVVSCQTCVDAS
jgi:translocator assembly and maintenance protein 41